MSFRIALPAVFLALSAVLCPLTAAAAARALLISDVHLDPFVDVAQARAIEHLPVEAWPALFTGEVVERPDFHQCAEPGPTTSPALWARTLQAITAAADDSAFTVVSGDLLVHQMQCRHGQLFPDADAGQYREFAARMVTYILRSVRAATHGRPVYLALGNHDSGCGNYRRDVHDPFLARLAGEVAAAASSDPQEQAGIGDSFARHGAYRIAQAPVAFPLALAVVDTTPLSRNALACDGTPADGAAEAMHWLEQGIHATAAANRPLWVIGHIPPGVDVRTSLSTEPWAQRYASVVVDGHAQTRVVPFLADERLATIIAADAATVKLALFGHTHMNEWRLLGDVPTKLLPSVSPSNGNFPAFTIGTINGDGTLLDYQVHAATDLQASAWTVQPSFRSLYGVSGFSADNIALLLREARPRYRAQYMIGQPQAPFLDDDSTFGKYLCSLALIAPQDYARCAAAAVDSH